MLDRFEKQLGHYLSLGFVIIQRPFVLFTMGAASVAFFVLGIWAIVKMIMLAISGEASLQEDANPLIAIGLVLVIGVVPFLLSWVSVKYARKALTQIREDGWLYKD